MATNNDANDPRPRLPYHRFLIERPGNHPILAAVEQSECLSYIEASNKASNNPTGWGLLHKMLNSEDSGLLRGFHPDSRIVKGRQLITRQKGNTLGLLSACKKHAEKLEAEGTPLPAVVERGVSYLKIYTELKGECKRAKAERKRKKEAQQAKMESYENEWGLQPEVGGIEEPARGNPDSDLSRQTRRVSMGGSRTPTPVNVPATATAAIPTRQPGTRELPCERHDMIVHDMVEKPLARFQKQQDESAKENMFMGNQYGFMNMFKAQLDSAVAMMGPPPVHGGRQQTRGAQLVQAGSSDDDEQGATDKTKRAELAERIQHARRLEETSSTEQRRAKYRAKREELEDELFAML